MPQNIFGNIVGNTVDWLGTTFDLPEIGLSENLAGGKTANTGRVTYGGPTENATNLAYQNLINDANKQRQGGGPTNPEVPGGDSGGADPYAPYGGYANYQAVQRQNAQRAAQRAQLQAQIDQLDPQQRIGLSNIANSYNRTVNRLGEQRGMAERDYTTRVGQNGQQYSNTRNGIQQNTRATANSLQRLLGMNGAGFSSAALEQAPYAAALQGTQNLSQAQQTYANNGAALDTNWQDTERSYKNNLEDVGTQKYQQENGLRSSIAQTRANLLSQMQAADGSTAYQSQINNLLGQITNYGKQYENPVMRAADVKFAAPDMGQYNLTRGNTPQGIQQNGGAASEIAPSLLSVLTDRRDEENLLG